MRQPSTIDLSQLPPPDVVEALDAESYVAAAIADYRTRWPEFSAVLESEPVLKFIEVLAARETLLRNRVNMAARAVLLPFARGADLEHLGALYGVEKLTVDPAHGTKEDDEPFRHRIQLAPESFSVAGPAGAYEYHALTASPEVKHAHAFSPGDGQVTLVVAGANGADVSDDTIRAVFDRLDRTDRVPLTDHFSVIRAKRSAYDVSAELVIPRGPDARIIQATAEKAMALYAASRCEIASTVYRVGFEAAAKVGGVDNVVLGFSDLVCDDVTIPVLRNIATTARII